MGGSFKNYCIIIYNKLLENAHVHVLFKVNIKEYQAPFRFIID